MPTSTSSQLPIYAAAFLAGAYTLLSLPSLDAAYFLIMASPLVFILAVVWKSWRIPVLFFVMAYVWTGLFTAHQLEKDLPEELAGEIITVDGRIVGLSEREGRVVRFNLDVFRSDAVNGKQLKGRIRVSDYRRQSIDPQPGEAWRLLLRVKPRHGFANPAGFDYEKWLFNNRIIATAYIRKAKSTDINVSQVNHRLPELDHPAYIDRLRRDIARQINKSLAGSSLKGIITALATGDRRAINTRQWSVLQKTGTSHLMAISGLHVGIVAGITFFLFRFLWSSVAALALRFPAHKAAVIAALLVALFYSLLAGLSLPTQRALLMLTLVGTAVVSDRHVRALDVLSLTLLLVVLFDPFSILSAGFWLSFGAVAMILFTLLFQQHTQRWENNRAIRAIRLQWKLSLMMAPVSLLFFQQIPLLGPIANIIAIPVVALIIVPLVLLASLSFLIIGDGVVEQNLYQLADFLFKYLWHLLDTLAITANAIEFSPALSFAVFAGLLFIVLVMQLPAGLHIRKLALIGLLPFFFPMQTELRNGEFRMVLLDVGQGLSVIIKTGKHTLLFDTGARFSKKFNAGDAVILPVLKSLSINKVDKLLISHGDNDHSGGMKAVLSGMDVQQLMSNEGFSKKDISNETVAGDNVISCMAGKQWQWEGVSFRILHPQKATELSGNNDSCVLQVQSPYGSVLLPADIEKESEREIISRYSSSLASSILVAPHHGSNTSSSTAFLEAVSPRLILIPAGWMNRYRHPSNTVIRRITDRGISHLSTGNCGSIDVKFEQKGINVQSMRQQNRRIWGQSGSENDCMNIAIRLPEIPAI